MSAEALPGEFFMPEASTTPPAPADQTDKYDFLQRRSLFLFERLLAEIAERRDADTLGRLIEVVEDLVGHCQWCLAEDGRRFELLKDRAPLPGEGAD
jgi:hypothetical protein